MDNRHRDFIKFNTDSLIKMTQNLDLLVDELETKRIITSECAKLIKSTDDAYELYKLIPNCGPWAYKELIDALNRTHNQDAAFLLKENRLSNYSPPEGTSPVSEPEDPDYFEDKYLMKSNPRGAVLIVNVFKYDDNWREQRDGSMKDVKELTTLFKDMGYRVDEESSGKKADIEDRLLAWKNSKFLSSVDCGIIIIMAHGIEDLSSGSVLIETSDKKSLEAEWIISLLSASEAPLLQGKPKLIFVLTCRGKLPDWGIDMEKLRELQNATPQNVQIDAQPFDSNGRFEGHGMAISPRYSDILLIFPCAPGAASTRDPQQGSWFVQEMIRVFRRKAHKDDIETMLKEMDRRLIRDRQSGQKLYFQTVCYTSRGFKRRLFLNPISSFMRANSTPDHRIDLPEEQEDPTSRDLDGLC